MDDISNNAKLLVRANQIVCLEHQNKVLYGEAIELIAERGLCWFRPICLVITADGNSELESARFIDLQSGSDLLWPAILFRPALDLEIIDYLPHLKDPNYNSTDKSSNKQYFNKFVRQVWQANQDKFPSS